jgi:PHP domain-containing protein
MPDLHDLSCVVHVHSTYSDGTATVPEIAAAAARAGAGAVLITDHDTLGALRDGWEGRHDGVLVLVGLEVSPKGGHYLAFGVREEVEHRGRSARDISRAVAAAGAAGFAAHPFSEGARLSRAIAPPHGWPDLDDRSVTGIELWSLVTDTAESCSSLRELARFVRDPEAVIDGPPARHLAAWDRIGARRRMAAIGGLDAHQTGLRVRGRVLSPMPHARWFSLLRTHALLRAAPTGELAHDRALVYEALREGSCLLHRPTVAPADGARMWAELPDGRELPMGAEAALGGGEALVRIRLPARAHVRVLRDGREIAAGADADALDVPVATPGAVRFEARRGGRLWLLSNPVHLRAR